MQQLILVEPAYLSRVRRRARRNGQLIQPLLLVVAAQLFGLLPGRRHQVFLVLLNYFGAEAGGDAMARIQIEIVQPLRRRRSHFDTIFRRV